MLGSANSGKGTQAKRFISEYRGCHISTGELIRAKIESDDDFRSSYADKSKSGDLFSDELVLDLTYEYLKTHRPTGIVILDGWCRTKHQADSVDKIFVRPEHLIAFDFDICLSVAQERARNRGREDDKEIHKRFRLWQEHREDVIHKLKSKGVKVVNVDGRHNPDHVRNSVKNGIVGHIRALKGMIGVHAHSRRHAHHI